MEFGKKAVDVMSVQPPKPCFPETHHLRRCLMKKSQMFRIAQIVGGVGAAVAVFAAPLKWW